MTLSEEKQKKIDDLVTGWKVNRIMSLESQVGALREMVVKLSTKAKVDLEPNMVLLETAVSDAKKVKK